MEWHTNDGEICGNKNQVWHAREKDHKNVANLTPCHCQAKISGSVDKFFFKLKTVFYKTTLIYFYYNFLMI